MVVLATLLARAVGVKEGESTLSVFLGLSKQAESANIFLDCTIKTPYHGAVLSRSRLWAGLFGSFSTSRGFRGLIHRRVHKNVSIGDLGF
jgi:hypothetical protein